MTSDQGRGSGSAGEDVLVVGAGPTGLFAAALLARCGIAVRLIDGSPGAAKESRAFAVHARTLELMLFVGLAEAFMARGVLATGARICVDGEPVAALDLDIVARRDTPYPTILFLPQSDVEEILNEDLARLGIAVERGVTATGLAQDESGVTVAVQDESGRTASIRAAYVLGADGAHSMVRKALGLAFEGAAYPRTFLLADCKVDGPLEPGPVTLFLNGLDVAGYFPLRGRDYGRVLALEPPTEADPSLASQGSSPVDLSEVETCFRAAAGPAFSLRDPLWTSRYRIHHRGVDRYGAGRVFVAGDAAHIHSPVGGQGMNTGLQDAANLAWKIALAIKAGAPPALLDSYDAERRPVGRKVAQFADRGFELVTTKAGWVSALRDAAAPLFGAVMARSDALRARAFHFVSQLGIRYHAGPAVQAEPKAWPGGPEPGRRAPDAPVARRLSVFDLLAGYRFRLLAFSRTALDEAQVREIAEALERLRAEAGFDLGTSLVAHSTFGRGDDFVQAETGAVFGAYGIDHATPQGLYLIRPDGHVAWRARGLDFAGCRAFIRERFRSA
ncbi:FAD-dependent monooxygenase [Enterovirga sp.]|uniref:FAD-dependent monooxygenase n=1 Tax=Enterovirga sp. TaxID=2026350 RepID=UPI002C9ED5B8|nr:FAD-dependent monooxygenase [Enterovirga sp.]HMO28150.1 FAD-dependent monooxygenase [Enterovirga sp.]